MGLDFVLFALFAVSIFTNLTVQAIKKLLNKNDVNYSSNVLAVVVSSILSAVVVVLYGIYTSATFDAKMVLEIVILIYLSFLCSTLGYDKVVEAIKQIGEAKKTS